MINILCTPCILQLFSMFSYMEQLPLTLIRCQSTQSNQEHSMKQPIFWFPYFGSLTNAQAVNNQDMYYHQTMKVNQQANNIGMGMDYQIEYASFILKASLLNLYIQTTNFHIYQMEGMGLKQSEIVIVKKEREEQYDESVSNRWREARSAFFLTQIPNKLTEAKANESTITEILQMYLNSRSIIDLEGLGKFKQYRSQVQQLNQRIVEIQKHFSKEEKDCLPMKRIMQQKITSLTVINIQYQPNCKNYEKEECQYSISAFELFRVVHENKMLTEVTLKKVFVQQFQLFIKLANTLMNGKDQKIIQELVWMKDFSPSKGIRLTINTKLQFDLSQKQETLSKAKDLMFFQSVFEWLSDITVEIKLAYYWMRIKKWAESLLVLWECLRKIKKIKIILERFSQFHAQQTPLIRSVLFGGLASFTEISQLSILGICFSKEISPSDFLAMEQILSDIFENNAITHLKINHCSYFPILPNSNSLLSINLGYLTFRRQLKFISQTINSNLSLKSIKCHEYHQEWSMDERLVDQLQTLLIHRCNGVTLDISSKSPSNIKYLYVSGAQVANLKSLFPKMARITSLQLSYIDLESQVLKQIPSPNLSELFYLVNEGQTITQKDLQYIDQKWPNLRNLGLYKCPKVTENVWNICKFKGLKETIVDSEILGTEKKGLYQLKKRGIKADYW